MVENLWIGCRCTTYKVFRTHFSHYYKIIIINPKKKLEVVCASISLTIRKHQCTPASAGLRAGSRGVSSGADLAVADSPLFPRHLPVGRCTARRKDRRAGYVNSSQNVSVSISVGSVRLTELEPATGRRPPRSLSRPGPRKPLYTFCTIVFCLQT